MTIIPTVGCFPSLERDQVWLDIRYVGGGRLKEYAIKVEVKHRSNNEVAYKKEMRFEYILPGASFAVPLVDFPESLLLSREQKDFSKIFKLDVDEMDLEIFRIAHRKKLKKFIES